MADAPLAMTADDYNRQLDELTKKISLVRRLIELGWLPPNTGSGIDEAELSGVLKAYQDFFGIAPTGKLDRFTERSLTNLRFCGHPDVMPMMENLSQWPTDGRPVTWIIVSQFPTLPNADAKQAYAWACEQWVAACGIDLRPSANPKTADILVQVNPIDGRAGVLAQSQLPNGTRTTMQQFYDAAEPFVFSDAPKPHEIDIGRVMCHENGHVIGIPHIDTGNLLQPLYDLNIRGPMAGDVAEARRRYGPPKPKSPDPSPGQEFTIKLTGVTSLGGIEIPGFKVTKL